MHKHAAPQLPRITSEASILTPLFSREAWYDRVLSDIERTVRPREILPMAAWRCAAIRIDYERSHVSWLGRFLP